MLTIILATVIMCQSCYTTQLVSAKSDYLKNWYGVSEANIVKAFGVPDRTVNYEGVGRVLIYEKFTYNTTAYAYGDDVVIGGSTSHQNRSYIEFYMGNNDSCNDVRTNRTKVVSAYDKQATGLTVGLSVGFGVPLLALAILAGLGVLSQ